MLAEGKLRTLNDFIEKHSKEELIWINGYIAGLISLSSSKETTSTSQKKFTILYGTDTGNSKKLALEFAAISKKQGGKVKVIGMDTYKTDDLAHEKDLVIILSTHGDGDPPPSAKKFFDYIMTTENKYPKLEFAVLALGDTSYPMFCKAAEDVNEKLLKLGAKAVVPIERCDVDYQDVASTWFQTYLNSFPTDVTETIAPLPAQKTSTGKKYYQGIVKTKINLNGRHSNKETNHIEVVVTEPILFEPGDALGIVPVNKSSVVDKLFSLIPLDPTLSVPYKGTGHTLRNLLTKKLNIAYLKESQVQKYAEIVGQTIPHVRMDLIDLLNIYPIAKAYQFIEFLPSLTEILPRLYSICSSPQAHEREVHILVSKSTFNVDGENRYGLCSDMLSDFMEGTAVDFYIHKNRAFRLPTPDTDIIMIGPGTGIAPMRSFIEERDAVSGSGRNWLIFGEQHFTSDFFYQSEIQQYVNTGTLHQVDLAWSRDQKEKIYVQDRIQAKGKELYEWIKGGAHIFISGTRSPMSEDVERAIIDIIYAHSGKSAPESEAYWNELKESGIYKADVY